MVITNTTIAANHQLTGGAFGSGNGGGGILNSGGTLLLTNSTLADNIGLREGGGGIIQTGGTVLLLNTILAQNRLPDDPRFRPPPGIGPDCAGSIISLGHNLIGDLTGCTITLQPSDLTGDPGLGPFTDNGRPGNGHFPLLPTSQAIDTGNDAVCPRTDQLGRRRIGPCDIGAITFRDRDDRHQERRGTTSRTKSTTTQAPSPPLRRPSDPQAADSRREAEAPRPRMEQGAAWSHGGGPRAGQGSSRTKEVRRSKEWRERKEKTWC